MQTFYCHQLALAQFVVVAVLFSSTAAAHLGRCGRLIQLNANIQVSELSSNMAFSEVFVLFTPPHKMTSKLKGTQAVETFEGSNPYLHPLHREHLLQLLELGGSVTRDSFSLNLEYAARKYNELVDSLVSDQKIQATEAAYWSRIYVTPHGDLEFIPWGQPVPRSYQLFNHWRHREISGESESSLERRRYQYRAQRFNVISSLLEALGLNLQQEEATDRLRTPRSVPILSDADFTSQMSTNNGSFIPIAEHPYIVRRNLGGCEHSASLLSHDLGHLLGLRRSVQMMAFQKQAQDLVNSTPQSDRLGPSEAFRLVNEYLVMIDPEARFRVKQALKRYDAHLILGSSLLEPVEIRFEKPKSLDDLKQLALELFVETADSVYRIGGLARTPGLSGAGQQNQFDLAYFKLASLADLKDKTSQKSTENSVLPELLLTDAIEGLIQAIYLGSSFDWQDLEDYLQGRSTESTLLFRTFHF